MVFSVVGFLVLLVAVIGSGSMVGILGWLLYRIKQLEAGARPSNELTRILEHLDELRDDMNLTRNEVSELSERVEFTERLLSRGDASDDKPRHSDN